MRSEPAGRGVEVGNCRLWVLMSCRGRPPLLRYSTPHTLCPHTATHTPPRLNRTLTEHAHRFTSLAAEPDGSLRLQGYGECSLGVQGICTPCLDLRAQSLPPHPPAVGLSTCGVRAQESQEALPSPQGESRSPGRVY